jgi:SAM-dependent methyltransferase
MAGHAEDMRRYWDARAREDAFFFVDSRQPYRSSDPDAFWTGEETVDYFLGGLGVELASTDTALEIGCGVGRITRVLAARTDRVFALDISEEMLARAREHNPELDGSVDACVSVVVLQHMPDPSLTLGYVREVGRALRPGGWAALQVSNDHGGHRRWVGIRHRIKALVGRAPRGLAHPAWIGSAVELDALREAANDGGMDVEKVWGEGSQYCQVLVRKRSDAPATPPSA